MKAQLSNKFGYYPSRTVSVILTFPIKEQLTNWYAPLSPHTKKLHGIGHGGGGQGEWHLCLSMAAMGPSWAVISRHNPLTSYTLIYPIITWTNFSSSEEASLRGHRRGPPPSPWHVSLPLRPPAQTKESSNLKLSLMLFRIWAWQVRRATKGTSTWFKVDWNQPSMPLCENQLSNY